MAATKATAAIGRASKSGQHHDRGHRDDRDPGLAAAERPVGDLAEVDQLLAFEQPLQPLRRALQQQGVAELEADLVEVAGQVLVLPVDGENEGVVQPAQVEIGDSLADEAGAGADDAFHHPDVARPDRFERVLGAGVAQAHDVGDAGANDQPVAGGERRFAVIRVERSALADNVDDRVALLPGQAGFRQRLADQRRAVAERAARSETCAATGRSGRPTGSAGRAGGGGRPAIT